MFNDGLFLVVGEVDIFKFDGALDIFNHFHVLWVGSFLGEAEELKDALGSRESLLDGGGNLGDFGNRTVKLIDVLDEGLNVTD